MVKERCPSCASFCSTKTIRITKYMATFQETDTLDSSIEGGIKSTKAVTPGFWQQKTPKCR
jgi:hypothetical protein